MIENETSLQARLETLTGQLNGLSELVGTQQQELNLLKSRLEAPHKPVEPLRPLILTSRWRMLGRLASGIVGGLALSGAGWSLSGNETGFYVSCHVRGYGLLDNFDEGVSELHLV